MALLYFILGTVLIGAGGFLATYGWNLWTSKEMQASLEQSRIHELKLQRQGIIKTVALELVLNISKIQGKKFTETDEKELSNFVVFPRLNTAALVSVLNSTLFLEKRHRKFLDGVNWLIGQLNHFNHRIDLIEDTMHRSPRPETILSVRKKLRDSPTMPAIKKNLMQFQHIISTEYEDLLVDWFESELNQDGEVKAFIEKRRSKRKQN